MTMSCFLEFASRRHWFADEGKEEEARLPASVLLEEEGKAVDRLRSGRLLS